MTAFPEGGQVAPPLAKVSHLLAPTIALPFRVVFLIPILTWQSSKKHPDRYLLKPNHWRPDSWQDIGHGFSALKFPILYASLAALSASQSISAVCLLWQTGVA